MAKLVEEVGPSCIEDANGNVHWEKAMDEEMVALYGNETWEIVLLPKDKKPNGCRWVYKVKHDNDGNISKHNTRSVAKGYT